MTVPGWVKGLGVLFAILGVGFAIPLAVAGVALADGVTTDRTYTQTAELGSGGTVIVQSASSDLKVLTGPAGQVRVDEHDIVRALTRRLAAVELNAARTTLTSTGSAAQVTTGDEPIVVMGGFVRRELTVYVPADANLKVTSAAGDLNLSGVRGNLSIDSASGSVTLDNMDVAGAANVHVVSGDIVYSGSISGGHVDLSTVSGSVRAYIPKDTNVHFAASTVSGAIIVDRRFPIPVIGGRGPASQSSGDIGSGGPGTLTMSTISGAVYLRIR
ncbi:MAG TPA: DUF4097 family beta strand repeat-containing protein [Candidatus Dormibacteraeota bacterium]|jgi:hypothetical protein